RKIIDDLNRRLEQVQAAQTNGARDQSLAAPATNTVEADQSGLTGAAAGVRVGTRGAYMDIGLVGTFAAGTSTASDIEGGTQLGGHHQNQRGLPAQGGETTFRAAVDPYFRGMANVLFSIDAGGESFLELEEAYLETISLPGN